MSKGKIIILLASVVVFAMGATGCEKPKKIPNTVEWYMEPTNKQALDERIQVCNNNPGQLKDDPDCINAHTAKNKLFINKPAPTNW